jgi:Family of unknown function (DUF6288)
LSFLEPYKLCVELFSTLIDHMNSSICLFLTSLLAGGIASAQTFYKEPTIFSTAPAEEKSVTPMERFGPVGMAVEFHQPAFTLWAGAIEAGSPAEKAGLKKGQIIESINGEKLQDIDPRIQLGQILEKAEATDGVMKFAIQGIAEPIVVNIPVLGAYSKTWPVDCPKSEKIVRSFADYLSLPKAPRGFADAGMLFLLSTGEEKDLAPVKAWVHELSKKQQISNYAWHIGFAGIPLCEYYLRTGDPVALEVVQKFVEAATKGEYLDAWAGRGGVVKLGYGNGHLNAGGTAVVTFLLLAKQCGAEINESLLQRTLTHFFRYAGRGINPYGDDRPEDSFVDNGKHGNLAFAMAAAASLTPDGENSIYAKARDICANTGFYTTTFMLHGHTGGGIGELWRSSSMVLMREKKPLQYREFMDHRKWHYDLSRRFNASFGILGGAGYDTEEWGILFPWAYTFPRKNLRIMGAPPSKFSRQHSLPARPWGTEADDVFLSMDAVADANGKRADVSSEVLTKDSAKPLIIRINAKELSDDQIRHYTYHPEYLIRHMLSNNAAGLTCDYMFPKPGLRVRSELLEEFCTHADPRVRNAGFRAVTKAFNPQTDWCKKIFDLAIERLSDEKESWYVKDACFSLLKLGTADMIAPHVDLIIGYLKHPEQWLQNGALMTLAKVITDERVYEKVMPPVGELIRITPRQSTTSGPMYAIRQQLPTASAKVRELALKSIGDAYVNYSGGNRWAGGQDLTNHRKDTLEVLAATLSEVPGGLDVLYEVSKKQFPEDPLPHDAIFLAADPENFGPALKQVIVPLIREELIYQFIGQKRRNILNDLKSPSQRGTVRNSMDELVSLYQKVNVQEFDWKNFGPDLQNAEWSYFTFDPQETQKYDLSPWRFRKVTYPAGMENWFTAEFDPAKSSWIKGQFPIGQYNGKLAELKSPYNNWDKTPRSFWEKEVLLVNGTFAFPPLKAGHSYRLRVQTGQGVGSGDGFRVFINGKKLVEDPIGLGRRAGDSIRGGWITSEFVEEFAKGPVTIAATSFLRFGDRAIVTMPPLPRGYFSMWLEERKLPPLDATVLRKAASFVPLMSSAWQDLQDPAKPAEDLEHGKFIFDGKLVPNEKVIGKWKVFGQVPSVDAFDPAAKPIQPRAAFSNMEFKEDGSTHDMNWIWTADKLISIEQNTVHNVIAKSIGGIDYLFIEAGGFSLKNPAGWKTAWLVLKK